MTGDGAEQLVGARAEAREVEVGLAACRNVSGLQVVTDDERLCAMDPVLVTSIDPSAVTVTAAGVMAYSLSFTGTGVGGELLVELSTAAPKPAAATMATSTTAKRT